MDADTSIDSKEQQNLGPNPDLEIDGHELSDANADNIVKNHIIASMTLSLVPIPMFDLAALITTQMNMLRALGEYYDVPPDDTSNKSLITSLIGGSLPVLGVMGLSSFAKMIPGIGSLIGSASLSISSGAVTYAVGQTFITHFEAGGSFEDFSPEQAQVFFKQQLEKGKQVVQNFRDEMKMPEEPELDDTQTTTEKKPS